MFRRNFEFYYRFLVTVLLYQFMDSEATLGLSCPHVRGYSIFTVDNLWAGTRHGNFFFLKVANWWLLKTRQFENFWFEIFWTLRLRISNHEFHFSDFKVGSNNIYFVYIFHPFFDFFSICIQIWCSWKRLTLSNSILWFDYFLYHITCVISICFNKIPKSILWDHPQHKHLLWVPG